MTSCWRPSRALQALLAGLQLARRLSSSMAADRIATVEDYLRSLLEDDRDVAPEAAETITYQMPTFTLDGRHLVHVAAWKQHIGLYPLPSGDEAFERELAPYRAARGTARFPLRQPVPYDLIGRLVALLVVQRSADGR
jgi:uncharacterized protein YdhG (YjbR/CyaY superfamily)